MIGMNKLQLNKKEMCRIVGSGLDQSLFRYTEDVDVTNVYQKSNNTFCICIKGVQTPRCERREDVKNKGKNEKEE